MCYLGSSISLPNLHQIQQFGGVFSESAHHEDFKTPPDCWIWWRFGRDIEGQTFSSLLLNEKKLNFEMISGVFNLQ